MSKKDAIPPIQTQRKNSTVGVFQKDVVSVTHASGPWGRGPREGKGWCPSCPVPQPWRSLLRRQGVGTFFGQSWKGLPGTPAQMGKLRPRRGRDLPGATCQARAPSCGPADSEPMHNEWPWSSSRCQHWDEGATCLQGSSVSRSPENAAEAPLPRQGPEGT